MHLIVVRSELNAQAYLSQRSLQPEPIFRLLLKVAVKGTHQCDSLNFCGKPASQRESTLRLSVRARAGRGAEGGGRLAGRGARGGIAAGRGGVAKGGIVWSKHTGRSSDINLPGWRWAKIRKLAPVGSSSSLHTEACNALGASDGVIHSRISHEAACFRAAANARRSPTSCPPASLFPPALSPLALPSLSPGGAGSGGVWRGEEGGTGQRDHPIFAPGGPLRRHTFSAFGL